MIFQGSKSFNNKNTINFPSQLLPKNKNISQCLITNHLLHQISWRTSKIFQLFSAQQITQYIYKNISIGLKEIFNDQKILKLINDNEFQKDPFSLLLSTDKFHGYEKYCICCPMLINSKQNFNGEIKYFILIETSYLKFPLQFEAFKRQFFKSKNHPQQYPYHIVGESFNSSTNSNLSLI